MNNNAPYGFRQYGAHYYRETPQIPKTNRLVYVKGHHQVPQVPSQKILFNPKFMANKVFVNPNFNQPKAAAAIHINPSMEFRSKLLQMPFMSQPKHSVHINPKNVPKCILDQQALDLKTQNEPVEKSKNVPFVLTKTKLIRAPPSTEKKQRGKSVNSKYKIVKSETVKLSPKNKFKIDRRKSLVPKNNLLNLSGLIKSAIIKRSHSNVNINGRIYKKTKNSLRRASIGSMKEHSKNNIWEPKNKRKIIQSQYKLTNKSMSLLIKNKDIVGGKRKVLQSHYKLVNKSISPGKNNICVKGNKRTILQSQYKLINKSIPSLIKNKNLIGEKRKILQSHYKIVNKSISPFKNNKKLVGEVRKFKIVRNQSFKKRKFRKCNIPCVTFRKYGLCKRKDEGKCSLKHDPDQVALCTRFLQGACLKENCLLSHNVLPEKMATCKYYLEGVCLKESCPYLHVKISPRAEVCIKFLEGFCEKAAQCEKRHQYLCPDYEKYGECMKPRCQYPHGKMVRTYLIDKNPFAKKCSTSTDLKSKNVVKEVNDLPSKCDEEEKPRYYDEKESDSDEVVTKKEISNLEERNSNLINVVGSKTRPKLENLSAFIGFSEL